MKCIKIKNIHLRILIEYIFKFDINIQKSNNLEKCVVELIYCRLF